MPTRAFGPEVDQELARLREAARRPSTKQVAVGGAARAVPRPFPSPADWRDRWIYFLLIDRFHNPDAAPASTRAAPAVAWNQKYGFRQGGTFEGVRRQLGYLEALGAQAIWLSPVLKNSRPARWEFNYHGYGVQDFLHVDERFASDGTRATGERELAALVDEAHARGFHVIVDVVLNHTGRVFDYVRGARVEMMFTDAVLLDGPPGTEPPVRWIDGAGAPRPDWQDQLPAAAGLGPDDAVWPEELQRTVFFRRRGAKVSDYAPQGGFARGDFDTLRQLVVEYDATAPGQEALRAAYGRAPVLATLIRAHQYLIAKYDVDGFRIDTAKYVDPRAVETFGNAMREFALSVGKANFFTFAEVYDDERTIAQFVGRNSPGVEGYGVDAALDFPLFYALPAVAKGFSAVERVREVYAERRRREEELLSSHGEAGRFFVTFLDNHDQHERFAHPRTPAAQVRLGLTLLFCLQGIPCLYYGTEQGLQGAVDSSGAPMLDSNESVREALWGKASALDTAHPTFTAIRALADVRRAEPALRYGRLYFRAVSGNGRDFGLPTGEGGVVAFSRILADREVIVVANTHPTERFAGAVVVDRDLNRSPRSVAVLYGTEGVLANVGGRTARMIPDTRLFDGDRQVGAGLTAAVDVDLGPAEARILALE